MKYDHQIGIIGGGPAGSSMAMYLAQMDFDVCIFEKGLFPRETVCGEFLSHEVSMILKELNLYERFLKLNPNRISRFRLSDAEDLFISTDFDFDAYSLKRSVLDNFLLSEALKIGVKVYQPVEIIEVKKNERCFELLSKEGRHFFVQRLIAAYGKNTSMDRKLGRNYAINKTGLNALKFHIKGRSFNNFSSDELHIYIGDGIYCGVSSPGDDQLTFCYLENRALNQDNPYKKVSGLFSNLGWDSLSYKNDQDTFNSIKKYGIGSIHFGNKELVENDIFFIGDSARVIAPLAGDGIGMALETSRLLSRLFYKSEQENWTLDRLKSAYLLEWNSKFKSRVKFAKLIQDFIYNEFFKCPGIAALNSFPFLVNYLMKKTRSTTM